MDEFGLDDMDKRILSTIIEKFGGLTAGTPGTVAVAVGEDPGTLQEVYEPFLIQQGFLEHAEGPLRHGARLPPLRPHTLRRADDDL